MGELPKNHWQFRVSEAKTRENSCGGCMVTKKDFRASKKINTPSVTQNGSHIPGVRVH